MTAELPVRPPRPLPPFSQLTMKSTNSVLLALWAAIPAARADSDTLDLDAYRASLSSWVKLNELAPHA